MPLFFTHSPSERPLIDEETHPCKKNAYKHCNEDQQEKRDGERLQTEIVFEDKRLRVFHGKSDS